MSSTVGRLVVDVLTNQSGGGVALYDFVYIDTAHDNSFTTGTTSGYTGAVGVCIEPNGIANGASGRIQISGPCAGINLNASGTRGHYVKGYTVAKQATDAGASRVVGAFGQLKASGTSPTVELFGFPDAASSSAAAGTPAVTLSTTNSAGVAATFVATDATIAVFDATVPAALGTAAAGSAGTAARRDHVHPSLVTSTNYLGSPVTMTNANQYYDGPSLTLSTGTFLLIGNVSLDGNNASVTHTVKLWDGTTVISSTEVLAYGGAAGRRYSAAAIAGIVVIASGTPTWKISAAGDGAGGSILATAAVNGAGATASYLLAIQLK